MSRIHRVTHPIIGLASWPEIAHARKALSGKCCSWCHQPVPRGRQTQCGNLECAEMSRRAYYYGHLVRFICKRDGATCRLCGSRADGQVDHIVPVSLGGAGDADNLRYLCTPCHKLETARLRTLKGNYIAAVAQ